MTAGEITEEAVEAACKASEGAFWPEHVPASVVEMVRDRNRRAIAAALPHLRVQETRAAEVKILRDAAEAWGQGIEGFPYWWLLERADEIEQGKTPEWSAQ